ncbi:DUF2958 domain-containing protein [Janibacter melonis]|uniref:DUF2958 domain-containing protein n=1 Tax=Janibacter melonis TaxID=262209 RepID=A0A5P8FJK1_9MICO|nr:DUF2958 domain-containing protein [Janibacter melonis]
MPPPSFLGQVPPLYATENLPERERLVWIRYFCAPDFEWLVLEYEPSTGVAFGLADLGHPELGYFSLRELADLVALPRPGYPVIVERDLSWEPKPLSEARG